MNVGEDYPEGIQTKVRPPIAGISSLFLPAGSLSVAEVQGIAPGALAYLGDAVYELYIRTQYLNPPKRLQAYHHHVVAQVRAERQAQHLRSLQNYFTEEELDILRRGRNATTGKPRRLDPEIYQQATSFETLMGYLYLTNPQRLRELLNHLELETELEER